LQVKLESLFQNNTVGPFVMDSLPLEESYAADLLGEAVLLRMPTKQETLVKRLINSHTWRNVLPGVTP
jgi:hypothetical protein